MTSSGTDSPISKEIKQTSSSISDWRAWARTTAGIVVMLVVVQFLTGVLLAFYYVPSTDHAYTTVSFIEKVLSSGSWIRSVHNHGSQWLSLFVFLHVARLYWDESYRYCKGQWISAVVLVALVVAAGATGYSLPWDARAFFSTRVAEGLVGGLPGLGGMARLWLLGGNEISTLTISRFFALHALVTPFLILAAMTWTIWRGRSRHHDGGKFRSFRWPTIARHSVVAGVIFAALALWSLKFPAPLGPLATSAGVNYLPRPGAQFIWLYQSLKFLPGSLGSIAGVVLPGLFFLFLAMLPWLKFDAVHEGSLNLARLFAGLVLGVTALLIICMTVISYVSDRRDPRTNQQLARQAAAEELFRKQPFNPALLKSDEEPSVNSPASSGSGVPAAYTKWCANCHGQHGEGGRQGNLKFPTLLGVSTKPKRSAEDIVSLLNDPPAYGLEPPMRSFATKLTEKEKQEVAEWVVRLR